MTQEDYLQSECVRWFRYQYPEMKKLLFAVPNGGKRGKATAAILKAVGVVAGVSDLILLVSKKGYGSLCIEMKTPKGRQSDDQAAFEIEAISAGNKYELCRSFDEFKETINNYLS